MLSTLLLWTALSTNSLAHAHDNPDAEAEEIFRARTREMIEVGLRQITDLQNGLLAPGPSAHPDRFISNIQTPPPPMRVALTFDDGPDASGTPYILEVLAKYNIHAAFFMKGNKASEFPDLVKRVSDEGHLIVGNHSWSHPDFHTIPPAQQEEEVRKNFELLGDLQSPMLFRYPFGNSTPETNALVHDMGYKIVGWHVDSCDWAYNKTGSIDAVRAKQCAATAADMNNFQDHVVHALQARKGGILLMHEIQPNTIVQLDEILARLVHEGFTFGTLDEPEFQSSLY